MRDCLNQSCHQLRPAPEHRGAAAEQQETTERAGALLGSRLPSRLQSDRLAADLSFGTDGP